MSPKRISHMWIRNNQRKAKKRLKKIQTLDSVAGLRHITVAHNCESNTSNVRLTTNELGLEREFAQSKPRLM